VKKGFSLIEVLVATILVSSMLISAMSFIQFAMEMWKRGEQTVNLTTRAQMVFDLIGRDLVRATGVASPAFGLPAISSITYDIPISTGTYYGTGTFRLEFDPSARTVKRKWLNYSAGVTKIVSTLVAEAGSQMIFRGRYEYTVARDVASFTAVRLSNSTVEVGIRTSGLDMGNTVDKVFDATMTYIIPVGK